MMRVLKPLQERAAIGPGKRLVVPEPRRVRFLIRGEGPVSAGAVTIECCPESTKAGKFWMELATIPVPADDGLAQSCARAPRSHCQPYLGRLGGIRFLPILKSTMLPDCHGLDARLILSIVLGGTSALHACRVWGAVIFSAVFRPVGSVGVLHGRRPFCANLYRKRVRLRDS